MYSINKQLSSTVWKKGLMSSVVRVKYAVETDVAAAVHGDFTVQCFYLTWHLAFNGALKDLYLGWIPLVCNISALCFSSLCFVKMSPHSLFRLRKRPNWLRRVQVELSYRVETHKESRKQNLIHFLTDSVTYSIQRWRVGVWAETFK